VVPSTLSAISALLLALLQSENFLLKSLFELLFEFLPEVLNCSSNFSFECIFEFLFEVLFECFPSAFQFVFEFAIESLFETEGLSAMLGFIYVTSHIQFNLWFMVFFGTPTLKAYRRLYHEYAVP
jgi:hypothetical protein